jgi:hypothetical protein
VRNKPIVNDINERDALRITAVTCGKRQGVRRNHRRLELLQRELAVRGERIVNERQEGSNRGCVIRIECKQTVKGRRFEVNGGVQLVALVGRKWRFWGLKAGSSGGFAVYPALRGGA